MNHLRHHLRLAPLYLFGALVFGLGLLVWMLDGLLGLAHGGVVREWRDHLERAEDWLVAAARRELGARS